eukprot:g63669.t1
MHLQAHKGNTKALQSATFNGKPAQPDAHLPCFGPTFRNEFLRKHPNFRNDFLKGKDKGKDPVVNHGGGGGAARSPARPHLPFPCLLRTSTTNSSRRKNKGKDPVANPGGKQGAQSDAHLPAPAFAQSFRKHFLKAKDPFDWKEPIVNYRFLA